MAFLNTYTKNVSIELFLCLIGKSRVKELKAKEKQIPDINELIRLYHKMVYRCCYSFLFNKEDAEDLSQEVFITVYHSLDSFKHKSKISTWIMRIAINKSLNHLRLRKKFDSETEIEPVDLPQDLTVDHEEDEAFKAIKKKILKQLIDELPENQRIAFVMNKYNGLTAKEIAEINKKSVNSVELLIHRAYKQINEKALKMYHKHLDV